MGHGNHDPSFYILCMTKNKKYLVNACLLLLLLLAASCNKILGGIYGVRDVKDINTVQIQEIRKADALMSRYPGYYVDSSYVRSIYKTFKGDSITIKNLFQPMQAMYFNEAGQLVSYHINCNAGGFPNLKWNRNHAFDHFYPLTQTPCNSKLSPDFIYQNLKALQAEQTPQGKPVIIVFWSYQVYKQSKRLMRLVKQNNDQYAADKSIRLIFVNTDLLYQ